MLIKVSVFQQQKQIQDHIASIEGNIKHEHDFGSVIVVPELKHTNYNSCQQLHSKQQPHLNHPLLVQHGVDDALGERFQSIHDSHQGIGRGEPEHVR